MAKKKQVNEEMQAQADLMLQEEQERNLLTKNKKTVKDLIAPSGINAYNLNHLEIISSITRYNYLFFFIN